MDRNDLRIKFKMATGRNAVYPTDRKGNDINFENEGVFSDVKKTTLYGVPKTVYGQWLEEFFEDSMSERDKFWVEYDNLISPVRKNNRNSIQEIFSREYSRWLEEQIITRKLYKNFKIFDNICQD